MRKSEVANIAERIQETTDVFADQVKGARTAVRGWSKSARQLVQERPGTVLIGAVALGFVLAKVARHA
jgi:hypothetical protein